MSAITQYTSLLLDLEQLEKTMRAQGAQRPTTSYDTETSSHLAGECDNDGDSDNLATRAAAA